MIMIESTPILSKRV